MCFHRRFAAAVLLAVLPSIAIAEEKSMSLWPGVPPGRIAAVGDEADTTGPDGREVAGRPVIRLGNVSSPMLTVYSPPEDNNTGAAMLVCPGGGYHILAYDLEGTEVCQWLNSIGVTGILLKYRVPRPRGDARPIEPLQDAQRAMSLVRQNASRWGIDPERIGALGFSAGGHLVARLSTNYQKRAYEKLDATDEITCRPNFSVLVYPGYLFDRNSDAFSAAELPVSSETPPMFMTMAYDDPVDPENVLRFSIALKQVKVPVALHLYSSGGHGYGLRRTEQPVTTWPDRCEEWLRSAGWLE